eukprot:1207517-Rhodomonas_salina.1
MTTPHHVPTSSMAVTFGVVAIDVATIAAEPTKPVLLCQSASIFWNYRTTRCRRGCQVAEVCVTVERRPSTSCDRG